jgi:hypothetical protein
MPKCPNCFYELTLLERRRKYKCSKCSRLFPQQEIDNKEFIEFNKREKQKDKEELENEIKQKKEQARLEKEQNKPTPEVMHQKILGYNRNYREKNRELYNERKRVYWAKNKIHLTEKRKENYNRQKLRILSKQVLYRQNHKIEIRIKHLRDTQKALALRMLEIEPFKVYNIEFREFMPTLALSDLLKQTALSGVLILKPKNS